SHVFVNGLTLATAGTQTVTATDVANSGSSGSATLTVNPGAPDHLIVTGPSSATASGPFSVTVKAQDSLGNTVTGYNGTVLFSRTDTAGGSAVPGLYAFVAADNG